MEDKYNHITMSKLGTFSEAASRNFLQVMKLLGARTLEERAENIESSLINPKQYNAAFKLTRRDGEFFVGYSSRKGLEEIHILSKDDPYKLAEVLTTLLCDNYKIRYSKGQ